MKKDQNLPNKTSIVTIVQGNHFQITILPLNIIHLTEITTAEDLQISHKIDIVDQTVKTIKIEIIFQDKTQTKLITPITKKKSLSFKLSKIDQISHKIDKVDLIVIITNVKITIQDQVQTEVITQTKTEIGLF